MTDPGADPLALEREATARLGDPGTRAEGHRQLAWLCLLHDLGCPKLREHALAARAEPDAMAGALLAAIGQHGEASVAARARAWLDLLAVAVAAGAEGDAVATLAAEATARLAVRDRAAVIQALVAAGPLTARALASGHPEQRWRRTVALLPLLTPAAPIFANPPAAGTARPESRLAEQAARAAPVPLPLPLRMAIAPASRRMFTGLAALTAPPFDLALRAGAPTKGDSGAKSAAVALVAEPAVASARYRLPAGEPGIYAVRALLTAQPTLGSAAPPRAAGSGAAPPSNVLIGKAYLVVRAPRPCRLWWNGKPLGAGPGAADTGRKREFRGLVELAPGANTLDLALSLGAGGEALDLVLLPLGDEPPAVLPGHWPEVPRDLVAALLDPAGPARARLARLFPRGVLAALVVQETSAGLDPSRTASAGFLDRVLSSLPRHVDARVDRIARLRDAGNPALALQQWVAFCQELGLPADGAVAPGSAPAGPAPAKVETAAPAPHPASSRADLGIERAQLLLALALGDAAARAIEAVVTAQPNDCTVFSRALELGLDSLDRALLRRLLARAPTCPAHALTLALAQSTVGDLGAARRTLATVDQPAAAREVTARQRQLADALGEVPPPPPAWLREPFEQAWRAMQEAEVAGDSKLARAALDGVLTGAGQTLEARQKALQAGAVAPWQRWLRSGEVLAQEPDDPKLVAGSGTAYLLDQEIVLLLPGGGALRRVHQVLRVVQDTAAEEVGEVRVPEDAELEFARTLLPDGSVVLPAETADKETVSLRAVAAGVTVEYAQVVYQGPHDPATGATRTGPFLLQAADGPMLLSEYVVLVPDGVTATFAASTVAPPAEIVRQGSFTAHIWRTRDLPRFVAEPRAVRPELSLPSVRVMAHADFGAVVEPWNEALAAWVDIRDDELDRWVEAAQRMPDGPQRWQRLAARLAKAVQHQHENGMPGRPDAALAHQKGDRAAVLYTLARRLGVDACLVRVLPLARLPAAEPADPDDYGLEVVRLRLPAADGKGRLREVWYDPGVEGGLLDHLRAGLRGRSGLLAGCARLPADPRVTLPHLGEGLDRREVSVELDWHPDGRVEGVVRDTVRGATAALVRGFLSHSTPASRADLVDQLGAGSFAGLTLRHDSTVNLDATDKPLVVVYRVAGEALGARVAALDLGLFSDELGQMYATLGERRTPLLFSHALDLQVQMAVRSLGAPVLTRPAQVVLEHPQVSYRRSSRVEGAVLHIDKRLRSQPAVIAPAAYPELGRNLRAIDAADRLRLERAQQP